MEGCNRKHHTLLHGAERVFPVKANLRAACTTIGKSKVLLAIVPVRIRVGENFIDTFGMLDTGSDASLISSDVADQLGLRGEVKPMTFGTFHGSENIESAVVNFKLSAVNDSATFDLTQAYTIPRLNASTKVANWDRIKAAWENTYGIELSSGPEEKVTVLIGADVPGAHEHIEIKKPPRGVAGPYAVLTPFGWSLFGKVPSPNHCRGGSASISTRHVCRIQGPKCDDLEQIVSDFWKLESLGIKSETCSQLSKEDQKAHEIMTATIKMIDGHYEVGLPWRSDQGELPNNQNMALRRFYNLENRF